MVVEYDSNNSGGSWWLEDKDWRALEKNGWKVFWHSTYRKDRPFQADEEGRWLGSLASKATKEFSTMSEAIKEWEKIVEQDSSDEGCNCCGPPHTFYATTDKGERIYVSGKDCLMYLFEDVPGTLREAAERLNNE